MFMLILYTVTLPKVFNSPSNFLQTSGYLQYIILFINKDNFISSIHICTLFILTFNLLLYQCKLQTMLDMNWKLDTYHSLLLKKCQVFHILYHVEKWQIFLMPLPTSSSLLSVFMSHQDFFPLSLCLFLLVYLASLYIPTLIALYLPTDKYYSEICTSQFCLSPSHLIYQ